MPESVRVPAPVFVSAPAPLITPLKATALLFVLIVPAPVIETFRALLNPAENKRVPPLKVTVLALFPSRLSAPTCNVPALMEVVWPAPP